MSLINKEQEHQDQKAWSNNVQKLKGYKELVEKVEYWAELKNSLINPVIIGPYEIVFDNELGWCVDVDGSVSFVDMGITEIPFQFRNVSGYFICSNTKLCSLKGCPKEVGTHFSCYNCSKLTSLEYCPKEVGDDFFCTYCGKKFTKEYVESLCDVKGIIYN